MGVQRVIALHRILLGVESGCGDDRPQLSIFRLRYICLAIVATENGTRADSPHQMGGDQVMTKNLLLVTGIMTALGVAGLLTLPNLSEAQTPATPMKPADCNTMSAPPKLTPVDQTTKDKILNSGLPCQESVNPDLDPNKTHLENIQRGFDFYSWLTFIALNSPADGSGIEKSAPNTKTKWEDMSNFRQLLDVMLPGGKAPKWGDEKIIPAGCRSQYKSGMMVIEMIDETFNQPFKTGPLIDQRGSYALFDILMNKQTFDYIEQHGLYSKPVQMSEDRSKLKIDFPAGESREIMRQVFQDIPESETKDDP